jgi:hypothetical protein
MACVRVLFGYKYPRSSSSRYKGQCCYYSPLHSSPPQTASERSRLRPELLSFRSSSADGKPKMIFPHGHNLNHHVNRERQVKCAQLPVNKTGSCFNMLFSRHLFKLIPKYFFFFCEYCPDFCIWICRYGIE